MNVKKKVDISCIAKNLRLSRSTVSKALNDRKDVSLKTKRRVKAIAKKMGYKPDYLARAIRHHNDQLEIWCRQLFD